MNKFLIAVIATTLVLFASNPSKAQGIPVYDASGYAQLIAQLDAMADDYANQIDQLEEAVRQADAITGTRNRFHDNRIHASGWL